MYDLSDDAFAMIFDENKLSCVFPVKPSVTNRRYLAQAIFVSLGNSNTSLMEQLLSYSRPEYLAEHVRQGCAPARYPRRGAVRHESDKHQPCRAVS